MQIKNNKAINYVRQLMLVSVCLWRYLVLVQSCISVWAFNLKLFFNFHVLLLPWNIGYQVYMDHISCMSRYISTWPLMSLCQASAFSTSLMCCDGSSGHIRAAYSITTYSIECIGCILISWIGLIV